MLVVEAPPAASARISSTYSSCMQPEALVTDLRKSAAAQSRSNLEEQHSASPTTLSSTIKPSYPAVDKRPEQDCAEHGPRTTRQGRSHGKRKSLNGVLTGGGATL